MNMVHLYAGSFSYGVSTMDMIQPSTMFSMVTGLVVSEVSSVIFGATSDSRTSFSDGPGYTCSCIG